MKMNSKHRKMLLSIFAKPTNPNIDWAEIEALLVALGCQIFEKNGSGILVEKDGLRLPVHRPHPHKFALRYRVNKVREFLLQLGIKP